MTRAEWARAMQRIRANWPHARIAKATMAKWFSDLSHLPGEQVTVAIEALYRDGREFPPNGAQILAKVSELGRDELDHGAAWTLAKRAALKADPKEAQEWLRERSPAAAEAVQRFSGGVLSYQLDEESTVRAQFREVFKAVVAERKRDDAYAGLPHAGLRGLQRGPRKLSEALQRALPKGAS